MALTSSDAVRHPAHYTMYPVETISITRHLGFCLGNAVKYVLRAPWKNGVEDCDKALQYLEWEQETPQAYLGSPYFAALDEALDNLIDFLAHTEGDKLWTDISAAQCNFLCALNAYLVNISTSVGTMQSEAMASSVRTLSRILALRDTTGQIYGGMTGLPQTREAE